MISKAAIRISLMTLDSAMEREETTSARIRIHNAMCELTHELIERQAPEPPAGTGPFTMDQLFPPRDVGGFKIAQFACLECGSNVDITSRQKHTEWHNKVADL